MTQVLENKMDIIRTAIEGKRTIVFDYTSTEGYSKKTYGIHAVPTEFVDALRKVRAIKITDEIFKVSGRTYLIENMSNLSIFDSDNTTKDNIVETVKKTVETELFVELYKANINTISHNEAIKKASEMLANITLKVNQAINKI